MAKKNVFEFDDIAAEEIVTRRQDVDILDLEDSMETWKEIIFDTGHTLYPVCEGSADKIVGILNAKKYFRLEDKSRKTVMEQAVSPAYFVPDKLKADTLFRNMKKDRQSMAVALDEYGGMTGIVTINDLVELLVGDLGYDEGETEEETIVKLNENTWKVHGSVRLEEIAEAIGVKLPCDDYDTFNGLVFHELEGIPENGTDAEFDVAGLRVKITKVENHLVESAIVVKVD